MSDSITTEPTAQPTLKSRSKVKRNIIITVIFILFVLLAALIYFYLTLLRPKVTAEKPQIEGYQWVRSIYGLSADNPFKRPHYVTTDEAGNIYVADSGNSRVLKFSRSGNYLQTFGELGKIEAGDTKGKLVNPLGVAVAENGDVVVTDRNLHKVVIFDADGKYKRNWQVMMPLAPKIVKDKIYLTTYGPFYIYDMNGKELAKWSTRGQNPETFDFPNGVEVDSKGQIYIADTNNNQIKAFAPNGTLIYAVGKKRTKPIDPDVDFDLLQGLTFDELGLLYAVDAFGFNIRVLSHIKEAPVQIVETFGKDGIKDGEFTYPAGIVYLGNREFAIADEGNNRVQVVRIPVTEDMKKAAEETKVEAAVPPPSKSIIQKVID